MNYYIKIFLKASCGAACYECGPPSYTIKFDNISLKEQEMN